MMMNRLVISLSHSRRAPNTQCLTTNSRFFQPFNMQAGGDKVDTTGMIKDINSKIGGILGLAGAPTFQRGENVIILVKKDHRHIESMYETYKRTEDLKVKQEVAWAITKELVQHSEIEQQIVYPLLKLRGAPVGQIMHDRSLQEHQEIRELLYILDKTCITDPAHPARLKEAVEVTLNHVQEEEGEVLPFIAKNYTEEELERVGAAFEHHKYLAPTRPHPNAPMQGPLAAAAGLATKPLDMARDVLRDITEKI